MKELNDIDFDKAFKIRITEELPEFEEESWLKMEKKLRKRDRLVYYRYASILLVLLSFGVGFYLINKDTASKADTIIVKKANDEDRKNGTDNLNSTVKPEKLETVNNNLNTGPYQTHILKNHGLNITPDYIVPVKDEKIIAPENSIVQHTSNNNATKTQDVINAAQQPTNQVAQNVVTNPAVNSTETDDPKTDSKTTVQTKVRKKIPISIAFVASPDFSSTSSLIGGKAGVSFGATVAIGLTKRLSIQTGVAFGSKNYNASAYDYTFNNPNTNRANYAAINAACKVVEVPLRASYNISENQKRSIEVNAGLSSYFMVREQYIFKYTPAANRGDRYADIANENQHYLSVVELSATYNIKLKNKQFAFGIEPYVKIPLSGIGAGNVPLKSSGISLKLRYDFNKK